MEMKKIMGFGILAMLLLTTTVRADTNVTIDITSDENVNSEININADNVTAITNVNASSFNWWINGYPGSVPEIKNTYVSGTTLDDIAYIISNAVDYVLGLTKYVSNQGMSILNSLAKVFVTRMEYNKQQENMNYLLYRIDALEKAVKDINATAWCNGRIQTMLEYNLSSVRCENTTYYPNNNPLLPYKAIGITPME
jgi:hypothetical protein